MTAYKIIELSGGARRHKLFNSFLLVSQRFSFSSHELVVFAARILEHPFLSVFLVPVQSGDCEVRRL